MKGRGRSGYFRSARMALPLLLLLCVCTSALAQGSAFTIIAREGDVISGHSLSSLRDWVSLNDMGELVYASDIDGGKCTGTTPIGAGCALFSTTRGVLVRSRDPIPDGRLLTGPRHRSRALNNLGAVGFHTGLMTPSGSLVQYAVYIFDAGSLIPVVGGGEVHDGVTIAATGPPNLNDNGLLVFDTTLNPSGSAIWTWQAGAGASLVASNGDVIDGRQLASNFSTPVVNNNDDLLFHADLSGGGRGLVGRIGGTLELLAVTGDVIQGRTLSSMREPVLNDQGVAAFLADFSDGGHGVAVQDGGGGWQLIAESGDLIDGVAVTDLWAIDINNNGDVIFSASGSTALFSWASSVLSKVAAAGDEIEPGRPLRSVGSIRLNNLGDVVFRGILEDSPVNVGAIIQTRLSPPLACEGFGPPVGDAAVKVKKNHVLPLRATLLDENGAEIVGTDLASPPVLQVLFSSGVEPAIDVSDDALSAGAGTDGNQFEYLDGEWRFNLRTANYTAVGTYIMRILPGDTGEYAINPTCEGRFVIEQ